MIDIELLLQDFGRYYKNGGQGKKDIRRKLLDSTETAQLFPIYKTDDTLVRSTKTLMNKVHQSFQKKWTPKGDIKFTPLEIKNFKHKINLEFYPDDLERSYLGFEEFIGKEENRALWPFIKWFILNEIIPQDQQDVEVDEIFFGKYADPVDGTPSAPGTSMDGIKTIINKGIDAGSITPIVIGAWDSDDKILVEQMEAFVEAWPEPYKSADSTVFVNRTLATRYMRGFDLKYNQNHSAAVNNMCLRYRPNISIKGLRSHGTSQKIWSSPVQNRVKLVKKSENMDSMGVTSKDFTCVQVSSHYWMGIGFWNGEEVFTNDRELAL